MLFPDLADRVSDDLYSKRMAIGSAVKSLPLGNRAENQLATWFEDYNEMHPHKGVRLQSRREFRRATTSI